MYMLLLVLVHALHPLVTVEVMALVHALAPIGSLHPIPAQIGGSASVQAFRTPVNSLLSNARLILMVRNRAVDKHTSICQAKNRQPIRHHGYFGIRILALGSAISLRSRGLGRDLLAGVSLLFPHRGKQ